MDIPVILTGGVALAIGLVGVLFLFCPQWIGRIEEKLNANWGARELVSLRTGLVAERALEQALNRDIQGSRITWDGWTKRYPRPVGAALCLLAAWLWWSL